MVRLFKLLARFPLPLLRGLGSVLGLWVWLFSKRSRGLLLGNLAKTSAWARAEGVRLPPRFEWSAISRSGWLVTELPIIWARPALWDKTVIVGIDKIDSLLAQGRGLIILTPHLGAFELGPRLFARHHPISIMYRPARDPRMEAVLRVFRPSSRIKTVPANGAGVRHFVRTLRSGGVVGLLPDQVPSAGEGVWAKFFGEPAYTMTLPLRLAHMTGAPIVWALVKRVPGNWSMSMHGWQPGMDPSQAIAAEDWVSAARLMNQQVEALVMKAPQDYLWTYNRYRVPRPAEAFNG